MENYKLVEYSMEQFIDDFKKMLLNPNDYSISFEQNFTNESYFNLLVDMSISYIYDDRIELNGEGFSNVTLFFKDFKVIKQDGDFGRSYYILFDKNKNNINEYDLVINVTYMNEWL